MSFLTVTDLHKHFGGTEVLRGISFTLEKGEILAVIGSSGSGKTTLLRCLNFLENADGGKIQVDGNLLWDSDAAAPMSEGEKRANRLRFGLVFQAFHLFPQYTAFRNVTLAPLQMRARALRQARCKNFFRTLQNLFRAKERRLPRIVPDVPTTEAIEERAHALLTRVGLSEKEENYPCQLSGGQCQRVAIARALALDPDILCFDEPTSALDPELTGEVLKVIRGLKNGSSTMIVVTHEMEFARNVADKVIFMADGVIAEMGTPEEVFGNPQSEKTKAFLGKSLEKF